MSAAGARRFEGKTAVSRYLLWLNEPLYIALRGVAPGPSLVIGVPVKTVDG